MNILKVMINTLLFYMEFKIILFLMILLLELVKIMVEHDMKKVAKENAVERIINLAEYLEKGLVK